MSTMTPLVVVERARLWRTPKFWASIVLALAALGRAWQWSATPIHGATLGIIGELPDEALTAAWVAAAACLLIQHRSLRARGLGLALFCGLHLSVGASALAALILPGNVGADPGVVISYTTMGVLPILMTRMTDNVRLRAGEESDQ